MVKPAYDEFVRLSAPGLAVPVYREIFADFDTPVSAFSKVDDGRSSFLLESVEGGEQWGRYSFLGSRPEAVFRPTAEADARAGRQDRDAPDRPFAA
jgi:anthranilate synthase component 1